MKLAGLLNWFRANLRPARPDRVPFSEVPAGAVFWWRGQCYIKETELLIFDGEPIPRSFGWREMVEVFPKSG